MQAHKSKPSEIKQFLQEQGGYILYFDATCDGDSPHLLCAIAEEVDLVLGSVKVPSESTESIVAFLANIKEQYSTPLAGVCDMLKANLVAFTTMFPGIKLFVCHFHFLRDIGKDLMEYDYSMLRDGLKRYRVNARLKEISKKLQKALNPENEMHLNQLAENSLSDSFSLPNDYIAKVLVEWIRDFKRELNGYGFPFDQKYLVQFRRMREVYQFLKNIKDSKESQELKYFLAAVVEDPELKNCVARLEKKEIDFNRLRKAMKIALPEGKEGLNDDGSLNKGRPGFVRNRQNLTLNHLMQVNCVKNYSILGNL